MDLGELLISIRLNSSAALTGLRNMKTELQEVKRNADTMQQAMNKTSTATANVGRSYNQINNSLVTFKDRFAQTSSGFKKEIDDLRDILVKEGLPTSFIEKFIDNIIEKQYRLGDTVKDSTKAVKDNSKAQDENNKKLKEGEKAIKDNAASYRILAMYATAAFAGITVAIKKGIDAFNQYNNALVGLRSITQGTGNSFNEAQKFIEEYTQDGLIPAANAALALKNLLSRGYNMEQAVNVLSRLKDAAAFGRQGSLSLGDAVSSATEGLKNENSVLVDNAGITKNVSKMWEDYAKQIGKTVNDLTIAEKIQAEYNGIMEESRHQVGDAAKLTSELAGSQAKLGKNVNELGVAFGESLAPIIQRVLSELSKIVEMITALIERFPNLTSGLITTLTVLTGLIALVSGGAAAFSMLSTALGTLTVAMGAFNLSLGAVAPVLLAIGVIVGAGITAWQKHAKAVEANRKELEDTEAILKRIKDLQEDGIVASQIDTTQSEKQKIEEYVAEYEKLNAEIERLYGKLEEYNRSKAYASDGILLVSPEEQKNIREWNKQLTEAQSKIEALKQEAEGEGIFLNTAEQVKYTKALVGTLEEQLKITRILDTASQEATALDIANKQRSIQTAQNLIETYETAEKGTSDWIEAEKALAELFPQFSTLSGIKINAIKDQITETERLNNAEWALFHDTVKRNQQYLSDLKKQYEYQFNMGRVNDADLKKYEEVIKALKVYDRYSGSSIDDIPGYTPVRKESTSSSGKAEKTAYELAIELYQHRKNLGQLTLKDEVDVLNAIKAAHAKTQDEIWDIDERIYSARQALSDSIIKGYEDEFNAKNKTSERWINQQKVMNKDWEEEEIAALGRIKARRQEYLDKILNDESITTEKKAEIREREADEIEDIELRIFKIRQDFLEKKIEAEQKAFDKSLANYEKAMNRYVAQQKLRNKISESDEIKANQSILAQYKNYLSKIDTMENMSEAEKLQAKEDTYDKIEDLEDKIYSIKKGYLDEYLDEYYKSLEDEVDALEDAELKKLKAKKEAIKKEYETIEDEKESKKRTEKLVELRKREELYKNAVTKEGLKTLADIKEEIAKIEEEAEEERLKKEKETRLNAIDAEIEATENKYDTMRKQLESLRKDMENEVFRMAENIGNNLFNAQKSIADRFVDIFANADSQLSSFLNSMRDKVQTAQNLQLQLSSGQLGFISNVQESASKLVVPSLGNIGKFVGTIVSEELKQLKPSNVVFNDYGEKIFNSEDDDEDYANEVVSAMHSVKWGY